MSDGWKLVLVAGASFCLLGFIFAVVLPSLITEGHNEVTKGPLQITFTQTVDGYRFIGIRDTTTGCEFISGRSGMVQRRPC